MGIGRKGVGMQIQNGLLYWDSVKGRLEGKDFDLSGSTRRLEGT
jgi:hypothetical protein